MIQVGIEADPAQSDEDFHPLQGLQFAVEKKCAVGDFTRRRLVIRRSAAHGGGNVGVQQAQSVVAAVGIRLRREADAVQDWVHEASRGIAGKWTASAVAAVCSGREPEDDCPGPRISEAGNRLGPIIVIEIGAALFASDGFAELDETRAAPAKNHFTIDDMQGRRHEPILGSPAQFPQV